MAVDVLITRRAARDVSAIDGYLRETLASPAAADAFLDDLEKGMADVRRFPEMRPLCSDPRLASRGYRSFRVKAYIAIYSFSGDRVDVLHVFHQSQDYASLAI